jgi:hypothetical protein
MLGDIAEGSSLIDGYAADDGKLDRSVFEEEG